MRDVHNPLMREESDGYSSGWFETQSYFIKFGSQQLVSFHAFLILFCFHDLVFRSFPACELVCVRACVRVFVSRYQCVDPPQFCVPARPQPRTALSGCVCNV